MRAAALSLLLAFGAFAGNPGRARAEGGGTPSWWDSPRRVDSDRAKIPAGEGQVAVIGRLSATPEAAERDAKRALAGAIGRWLEPEVPADWVPPAGLVTQAIRASHVRATRNEHAAEPAFEEFPDLYRGGILAELGAPQRAPVLVGPSPRSGDGPALGPGPGPGVCVNLSGDARGLHPRRRVDPRLLHLAVAPGRDGRRRGRGGGGLLAGLTSVASPFRDPSRRP
jgi:hypothetical protein